MEGEEALEQDVERMKRADRMYHCFRVPDEDDQKASERGEPIKIVYPVTWAQIQTTLSVLMTIFSRTPFFELEGTQPQFHRSSKLMELELNYQMEMAGWKLQMYQWVQDCLKYGFGVLHTTYEKRLCFITKNRQVPMLGDLGGLLGKETVPVIGYEGAKFELGDPYTFRFDPAVSVGDIQRAQYVFHQYKRSYNEMLNAEKNGEFMNVKGIPKQPTTLMGRFTDRERESRMDEIRTTRGPTTLMGGDMVILDYLYVKLVPKDYELAEFDGMQIWKIVMANEARIVAAEPCTYEHGQFPVSVIEYAPDQHELVNDGMAQVIDGLQDLISWSLNTHINSVRRTINNQFIVDPSLVETEDIESRSPMIRLKAGARGRIEQAMKQFQVVDVTQGHVADAAAALNFIMRTTGVNDPVSGMPTPTSRTATESLSTLRGGQSRVNLLAQLLWEQGFKQVGKQMIQNTQQFMTMQRSLKLMFGMGLSMGLNPQEMLAGRVNVSPEDLQGMFNIAMVDTTTPQDKVMMASKLQEFVMAILPQPQIAMMWGLNPGQMIVQMLQNYGFKNTSDFAQPPMPPDQQLAIVMAMSGKLNGANGQPRGVEAKVMPEEHVEDQVQRGNLEQIDGGIAGGGGRIQ